MIYFITGKLGAGKSLVSVGKIFDYLMAGRPVATNLDLYFDRWSNIWAKSFNCVRLPDHPTAEDIRNLGHAHNSTDESRNGLLVLDECGTWFNSRTWTDNRRAELISVLVHLRKMGWDAIFIIQSANVIDKQAREMLGELVAYCRRMDRLSIPFFNFISNLFFGIRLSLPRLHIATVKYGLHQSAVTTETWWYRGNHLFNLYDTKQIFLPNYEHASFCYLPPYNLKGYRYTPVRYFMENLNAKVRNGVQYATQISARAFFLFGLLVGWQVAGSAEQPSQVIQGAIVIPKENYFDNVNLVGSISIGDSVEYFFERDGVPLNIEAEGIYFHPMLGCNIKFYKGQSSREYKTC